MPPTTLGSHGPEGAPTREAVGPRCPGGTAPDWLRRFGNVDVDDEDVRFLDGLDTLTPVGAAVSVIPAVAG